MLKIFLIRHGETEHNRDNIVSGISDSILTETGKLQSKKLAEYFSNETIDAIYTSPSSRALETAQDIAKKKHLQVNCDERLREINFGDWEGKNWDFVSQNIPNWKEIRHEYRSPNGETQQEVSDRVFAFLREIKKKHKEENIIIIGHGSVNKAFLGILLKISIKERYSIGQRNACINIIGISNNTVKIYKINDTAYLEISNHL